MTVPESISSTTSRARTFRIFISSPGDVVEERDKARQVIEALQRYYVDEVLLVPVLWEDLPLGADASFQQGIDLVLSRDNGIDIAVFVLWSRLGSPLGSTASRPDGRPYRSGTERELDLMFEARRQSSEDRPHILAYVRQDDDGFMRRLQSTPSERLEEEVRQQRLAQNFISESFNDSETRTNLRAYHTYSKPITFSSRLKVHLRELLDARLEGLVRRSGQWDGTPYRAFDVFDLEHADIYFGRERDVDQLEELLRQRPECSFVVVVGASGSGKSSLVRAGLASSLLDFNFDDSVSRWRCATMVPGNCEGSLLLGLARALFADSALPELRANDLTPEILAEGFAESPQSTLNLAIAPVLHRAATSRTGAVKLLLIVDQLEELYTERRITREMREQLYQCLYALASSGHCWVVATLRSDFYAFAQQDRAFLELKGIDGQMDLLAPEFSAIRRMIVEPARLAGLTWERDERTGKTLDQILVDDATTQPESLPLLEFALNELYLRRRGWTLTVSSYRDELGGLKGAVGHRAESAFAALPNDAQSAFTELLRELVTLDPETESRPVRRRAGYDPADLSSPLGELTTALVNARLLTASDNDGQPAVTLAHEALLTSWDRLDSWVKSRLTQLRLRARVEADLGRWHAGEKAASLLLPAGLRLEEARILFKTAPELLGRETAEYIAASIHHHEQLARNANRLRVGVSAALSVLLVLAIASTFYANYQRRNSNIALARSYLFRANNELDTGDHRKALFWLAQGVHAAPSHTALARNLRLAVGQITQSHLLAWPLVVLPHDQNVLSARVSPDGTHVLTMSGTRRSRQEKDDNQEHLWDASSGQLVSTLHHGDSDVEFHRFSGDIKRILRESAHQEKSAWADVSMRLEGKLYDFKSNEVHAFNVDGTRVLTIDYNTVTIRDSSTGQPIGEPLTHKGEVRSATFSPDGARIVTASSDTTARLWNAMTGDSIGGPLAHNGDVSSAIFSRDGAHILTVSGKTARVWDASTRQEIGEPLPHDGAVLAATLSPDGKQVVTSCSDETARIWATETGIPPGGSLPHVDKITRAAFSSDGARVITASSDLAVRVWDALTSKLVGNPICHDSDVNTVAFSPDGKAVLTSANGKVFLRNPSTGETVWETLGYAPQFSPDGVRIITINLHGTVRIWDTSMRESQTKPLELKNRAIDVEFSPDGTRIVTAGLDHTAQLWNAMTGEPNGAPLMHKGDVNSATFSPDGAHIVTVSGKTARVWNASTGQAIGDPLRHKERVRSANFSPDGKRVVTASDDWTARVWEVSTGRSVGDSLSHQHIVNTADFSPNGALVVTSSTDGTARVWDAATGKQVADPCIHNGPVNAATFSPDGARIVTASSDHTARLWDASTGRPIGRPLRHNTSVQMASISRDGTRVVTTSAGNAQVWDSATGRPIGEPLRHGGWVESAQFSPDGTRIITGSRDAKARLWDAALGLQLIAPLPHNSKVIKTVFSPDGMRIATQEHDGITRIWNLQFDPRAPEVVVLAGEVASGLALTPEGALGTLEGRELAERHERLRSLAPELFDSPAVNLQARGSLRD